MRKRKVVRVFSSLPLLALGVRREGAGAGRGTAVMSGSEDRGDWVGEELDDATGYEDEVAGARERKHDGGWSAARGVKFLARASRSRMAWDVGTDISEVMGVSVEVEEDHGWDRCVGDDEMGLALFVFSESGRTKGG